MLLFWCSYKVQVEIGAPFQYAWMLDSHDRIDGQIRTPISPLPREFREQSQQRILENPPRSVVDSFDRRQAGEFHITR